MAIRLAIYPAGLWAAIFRQSNSGILDAWSCERPSDDPTNGEGEHGRRHDLRRTQNVLPDL